MNSVKLISCRMRLQKQIFIFLDQDYQPESHVEGVKNDAESNFIINAYFMMPWQVVCGEEAKNNQYSIGSTMSHKVSLNAQHTSAQSCKRPKHKQKI